MQYQKKPIFISFFLVLVLLISGSRSQTALEVEDEREFDYRKSGQKGPAHWGELKPEWAACKNGKMQSPVDMSNKRVKLGRKSGMLTRIYKPANATLKNRGHDISIQWRTRSAGKIQINGIDYYLDQGHWHSPSEHTINRRRFDLELHMVHKSYNPKVKNQITVVALLYQIGAPNPFLSKLIKSIKYITHQLDEEKIGVVDPNEIKMHGEKYYRYLGSLTTPPCSEGVQWTINKEVDTVSKDQIKALKAAVHDYARKNARPLQPINNRFVRLYDSKIGEKTN